MTFRLNNHFQKDPNFRFKAVDAFLFLVLGLAVWAMNGLAHMFFPSQNLFPYLVRTAISAAGALILIFGSIKLLKRSHLPTHSLGLKLSPYSMSNFILGAGIAILVIVVAGVILYCWVPFHFVAGPLDALAVLKAAHVFFWGNLTEELLFRAYPLIILSQLLGWRAAVCIMAVPFGLFHLPGLGFSIEGLKMVLTTATFSFVFSYAFILTGTLWTAVGAHVVSNILLHSISGLDGMAKAMFTPVFETRWPSAYDPGLLSFEISAIFVVLLLYLFITKFKMVRTGENPTFQ